MKFMKKKVLNFLFVAPFALTIVAEVLTETKQYVNYDILLC